MGVNCDKDYFQFVTKSFEVIKVSAPHIYHSALELSPKSSIIQKHYHCQPFQVPKPRVVYGLPNSWNQPTVIKYYYGSCAWSPCGQFFSAQTPYSVEVWDAITIEKCSDLKIANSHPSTLPGMYYCSPDVLAYSPDGHSLAGCFGSVITIWDIQTGGVVEEIEHGVKKVLPKLLAWLLDGTIICATYPVEEKLWTVVTYYVASGKVAHMATFQSLVEPHLWSLENSLQAMTVPHTQGTQTLTINILRIWPISIDCVIGSFSITLSPTNKPPTLISPPIITPQTLTFSPSTHQVCITNNDKLTVVDIRNLGVLLKENSNFSADHFSPDGSLLVARRLDNSTSIWKYTPEHGYSLWREFPPWTDGNLQYY